jgi:hypothetical protein
MTGQVNPEVASGVEEEQFGLGMKLEIAMPDRKASAQVVPVPFVDPNKEIPKT